MGIVTTQEKRHMAATCGAPVARLRSYTWMHATGRSVVATTAAVKPSTHEVNPDFPTIRRRPEEVPL